MIITSLPRSGSTKYCMDLSHPHSDLIYVDEVFELGMTTQHKVAIHTITDIQHQTKTASSIAKLDFSKCVINNHEINWFMMENTDVFLSRQNVQDTVWSYVAYMDKYHRVIYNLDSTRGDLLMYSHLERLKLRIHFFYDYIITKNKTIVVPDLEFTDQSAYREQYSKWKPFIERMANNLTLPAGFVFT